MNRCVDRLTRSTPFLSPPPKHFLPLSSTEPHPSPPLIFTDQDTVTLLMKVYPFPLPYASTKAFFLPIGNASQGGSDAVIEGFEGLACGSKESKMSIRAEWMGRWLHR